MPPNRLRAVFFRLEKKSAKKQQIADVILLKHLLGMIRFSS